MSSVDDIFKALSECAAMNPDPCDEMLANADGDFFYDSERALANADLSVLEEALEGVEIVTGEGDLEDVSVVVTEE